MSKLGEFEASEINRWHQMYLDRMPARDELTQMVEVDKAVSQSPLTLHVVQGDAIDVLDQAPVLPRSLKLFGWGPCQVVKARYPQVATVMRFAVSQNLQSSYWRRGYQGGRDWVDNAAAPGDPAQVYRSIDYLEGANEEWGQGSSDADLALCDAFHLGMLDRLSEISAANGHKTRLLAYSFSVGEPDQRVCQKLTTSCARLIASGGLISDHTYWPRRYSEGTEWYALRLDKIAGWFKAAGVPVESKHFAVTETGTDFIQDWANQGKPSGPWRTLLSQGLLRVEEYEADLDAHMKDLVARGIVIADLYTFRGLGVEQVPYEHASHAEIMRWIPWHWQTFVGSAPPPVPEPPFKLYEIVYVNTDPGTRLVVRARPADPVLNGKLHRGHSVLITEIQSGWVRVVENHVDLRGTAQGESYGWLADQYLSRAKPIPVEAPDRPPVDVG